MREKTGECNALLLATGQDVIPRCIFIEALHQMAKANVGDHLPNLVIGDSTRWQRISGDATQCA